MVSSSSFATYTNYNIRTQHTVVKKKLHVMNKFIFT